MVTASLAGKDLGELGIPTAEQYIRMYCEAVGRDGIENIDFYLAFNMFRLAAILQGIVDALETAQQVRLMQVKWKKTFHPSQMSAGLSRKKPVQFNSMKYLKAR